VNPVENPLRTTVLLMLVILAVTLVVMPKSRMDLLGEFGWRYLMSTDDKVAYINRLSGTEYYKEHGEEYGLGVAARFIPYSSEMVRFAGAGPVRLELVEYGADEGPPLLQIEENTFGYESKEFPIRLYITVETFRNEQGSTFERPSGCTVGPNGENMFRIWIKAEPIT